MRDPISKTEADELSRGREIFQQKNTRDLSPRKSAGGTPPLDTTIILTGK